MSRKLTDVVPVQLYCLWCNFRCNQCYACVCLFAANTMYSVIACNVSLKLANRKMLYLPPKSSRDLWWYGHYCLLCLGLWQFYTGDVFCSSLHNLWSVGFSGPYNMLRAWLVRLAARHAPPVPPVPLAAGWTATIGQSYNYHSSTWYRARRICLPSAVQCHWTLMTLCTQNDFPHVAF